MIRHTVLFNVKSDIPKAQIESVFTDVVNLGGQLPGILSITGGTCYFNGKNKNSNFTHGFSIDFQDEKSRNAFLKGPITDSLKKSLGEITQEGESGVIGFDFGEWS